MEDNRDPSMPYEKFYRLWIIALREDNKEWRDKNGKLHPPSRGVNAKYKFNPMFRYNYGNNIDPVEISNRLAMEGKIEVQRIKDSAILYLPGEGPPQKYGSYAQSPSSDIIDLDNLPSAKSPSVNLASAKSPLSAFDRAIQQTQSMQHKSEPIYEKVEPAPKSEPTISKGNAWTISEHVSHGKIKKKISAKKPPKSKIRKMIIKKKCRCNNVKRR